MGKREVFPERVYDWLDTQLTRVLVNLVKGIEQGVQLSP
jgi:hypothetical protein